MGTRRQAGRVSAWSPARAAILRAHLAGLPAVLGDVDGDRLAAAADGFTGADLKRLVEDGKALFAYDKAQGRPARPPTEYFLEAVATVRANKARYAEAEARAGMSVHSSSGRRV